MQIEPVFRWMIPDLLSLGSGAQKTSRSHLKVRESSAIVTTHLRRSRETAAPLTSKLKINAQTFHLPSKGEKIERDQHVKEIVDAIRKQKNGAVLVVSHETTVPLLVTALGGPKIPDVCPSVYDVLFILAPSKEGVGFVSTRYGAVTECR